MENRKELSEKSKKLIAKNFNSDILNKSTGYYKTENIYPISSKPNELKKKYKEFIPKYKEIKPNEMRFNQLLSDQQKNNSLLMQNLKLIKNKKNEELEILRNRAKTIKENCYDEKGNFSARKRHLLEFYGLEKMNNKSYNFSASKNIIERRRSQNRSLFIQRIPKNLDINNDNNSIYSNIDKYSIINDKENNIDVNNNNIEEKENKNLNNNIDDESNDSNIIIKNKYNKKSRNINNDYMDYNLSTISNDEYQNTVNCVNNKENMYHRIKTDINFTDVDINALKKDEKKEKLNLENKKNLKKNFYHPKGLNKVFYTQMNKPVQSNRINKKERDDDEKEYYNIEIKNIDSLKTIPLVDKKKIKEIFYKNGLHIYDFNEDGMNILSRDKKMEAKLRKNKRDENFDRNYRNTQRQLKKLNIIINKREIVSEKGFESRVVRKKRKGTPGTLLYKNKGNKDENTKINTGFGFKRDKNILPISNNNYKNNYNYKMSYFNHNKK